MTPYTRLQWLSLWLAAVFILVCLWAVVVTLAVFG